MSDSSVAMNPTGGAGARHGLTQPALQVDLMQAVVAPENMRATWARVKSNKGASGIDGMPIGGLSRVCAYALAHDPPGLTRRAIGTPIESLIDREPSGWARDALRPCLR